MKPDMNAIRNALEDAGVTVEMADRPFGVLAEVRATEIGTAVAALEADGYEFLVDLFAMDTEERLEITYHLRAFAGDHEVYLRVGVEYDGDLPSIWETHPAALYPERETAELFGVTFAGHPNPKRLLTSDHVDCFLMRRDVPLRTHEEVQRDV